MSADCYELVARALLRKRGVSRKDKGEGFGTGALTMKGRVFAMRSSRGEFVVKLPRARVDELVEGVQASDSTRAMDER